MTKVRVIRKYHDLELEKQVLKGDTFEVSADRAFKLYNLGLVEILFISKLSKKEYEAIRSLQVK